MFTNNASHECIHYISQCSATLVCPICTHWHHEPENDVFKTSLYVQHRASLIFWTSGVSKCVYVDVMNVMTSCLSGGFYWWFGILMSQIFNPSKLDDSRWCIITRVQIGGTNSIEFVWDTSFSYLWTENPWKSNRLRWSPRLGHWWRCRSWEVRGCRCTKNFVQTESDQKWLISKSIPFEYEFYVSKCVLSLLTLEDCNHQT